MLGKPFLEIEFKKKALRRTFSQARKKSQFIADDRELLQSITRGAKSAPAKSDADVVLADRIEQIAEEHEKYGYSRMTAQLDREGISVNRKKNVSRIMREKGLKAKQTRRYVKTTDPQGGYQDMDCPGKINPGAFMRINFCPKRESFFSELRRV